MLLCLKLKDDILSCTIIGTVVHYTDHFCTQLIKNKFFGKYFSFSLAQHNFPFQHTFIKYFAAACGNFSLPLTQYSFLFQHTFIRYFAVACCKGFVWASCTDGFGLVLHTNKTTSFKDTLHLVCAAFSCNQKTSFD